LVDNALPRIAGKKEPAMLPSPSCRRQSADLVRLARSLGAAALLLLAPAAGAVAQTAPFLDDFEGEREYNRYPLRTLRHWTIVDSVDLKTERSMPSICRDTGTCIDLVGTSGLTTGGITSKSSFAVGTYLIGFRLYGSGRNEAGEAAETGGVAGRIQVNLGARSIYARNDIPSDFSDFVVLRVYGSGKLGFLAEGAAANIGPLVDNVVVIRLGPVGP
jgi:hypothetical protein